jgi:hypothetical protein
MIVIQDIHLSISNGKLQITEPSSYNTPDADRLYIDARKLHCRRWNEHHNLRFGV